MVTFDELRRLADSSVTDRTIRQLEKEIPSLNPQRANHVCRYVARTLGLFEDDIRAGGGWFYISVSPTHKTIAVHPGEGVRIMEISELQDEPYEEEEDWSEDCDCADCRRNRGEANEDDSQETNPDVNE